LASSLKEIEDKYRSKENICRANTYEIPKKKGKEKEVRKTKEFIL
jgi:hypothetical protein